MRRLGGTRQVDWFAHDKVDGRRLEMGNPILGETGEKRHVDIWLQLTDRDRQLVSAHPGHRLIGDDEVKMMLLIFCNRIAPAKANSWAPVER